MGAEVISQSGIRFIGIDPGFDGGLSFFRTDGELRYAVPMPIKILEKGTKKVISNNGDIVNKKVTERVIDLDTLANLVLVNKGTEERPVTIYLEAVHAYPG